MANATTLSAASSPNKKLSPSALQWLSEAVCARVLTPETVRCLTAVLFAAADDGTLVPYAELGDVDGPFAPAMSVGWAEAVTHPDTDVTPAELVDALGELCERGFIEVRLALPPAKWLANERRVTASRRGRADVERFFDECTVPIDSDDPADWSSMVYVYKVFRAWSNGRETTPPSGRRFEALAEEAGARVDRLRTVRIDRRINMGSEWASALMRWSEFNEERDDVIDAVSSGEVALSVLHRDNEDPNAHAYRMICEIYQSARDRFPTTDDTWMKVMSPKEHLPVIGIEPREGAELKNLRTAGNPTFIYTSQAMLKKTEIPRLAGVGPRNFFDWCVEQGVAARAEWPFEVGGARRRWTELLILEDTEIEEAS